MCSEKSSSTVSPKKISSSNLYPPALKQQICKALKNYNDTGTLKINFFTENERFFVNILVDLENLNPKIDFSQNQRNTSSTAIAFNSLKNSNLNPSQLRQYLSTVIAKRIMDFYECFKKINIILDDISLNLCDSLFDIDNVTLTLDERSAKALKEKWALAEEKVDSTEKTFATFSKYNLLSKKEKNQTFDLNYLSASEILFIDAFKKFLPPTHAVFQNLIMKTSTTPEFTFQNSSALGFNQAPISQPSTTVATTITTTTTPTIRTTTTSTNNIQFSYSPRTG